MLKSFGANNKTRVFWAGGAPFGGEKALDSLKKNFGEIHTKESLAKPGELDFFNKHGNMLAALDFILSVESDVFMPSHGGNMAHVIQVTIKAALITGVSTVQVVNSSHHLKHWLQLCLN